jgi:hypothetical protein
MWSVREYWLTVDVRSIEPRSQRPDLTGEEANLMDSPALGKGVLKSYTIIVESWYINDEM